MNKKQSKHKLKPQKEIRIPFSLTQKLDKISIVDLKTLENRQNRDKDK